MTEAQQIKPVKRSKRRIWLAAIAVMALALGVYFWISHRNEPRFQDKSLAYWFRQLPMTMAFITVTAGETNDVVMEVPLSQFKVPGRATGTEREKREDAERALRSMGTNALPFLLAKLQTRNSPFRNQLNHWVFKLGFKKQPLFENSITARRQAVTGLLLLRPLPEETLAQVRNLSTNSDRSVAEAAKLVLSGWKGPALTNLPPGSTIQLNPHL